MELRNKVAIAISGAPFPSTASLRKADAAIAVVLDALKKPSNGVLQTGAGQLFGAAYDDWKIDADLVWQAMLAAFRTEALGEG